MPLNNKISFAAGDTIVNFTFLKDPSEIKTKRKLKYYWYNNNAIKCTQGAFAGKLLDGPFSIITRNSVLLEKGSYKNGLKYDRWYKWHENGIIKESVKYYNKGRSAKFREFDELGNLKRKGKIKRFNISGTVVVYDENGQKKRERYENGNIILKKTKTGKKQKADSLQQKPVRKGIFRADKDKDQPVKEENKTISSKSGKTGKIKKEKGKEGNAVRKSNSPAVKETKPSKESRAKAESKNKKPQGTKTSKGIEKKEQGKDTDKNKKKWFFNIFNKQQN